MPNNIETIDTRRGSGKPFRFDCFFIGAALAMFVAAVSLTTAVFLLIGLRSSWLAIPAAALGLSFFGLRLNKFPLKNYLWEAVAVAGIIAGSIYAASISNDFSFDGQRYHKAAIIQLADGWNPYWDAPVENIDGDKWVNHYPKSTWFFASPIYQLTGSLEAGKAFQLILLAASLFLSFSLFRLFLMPRPLALLFSAGVAFNPVLIVQAFTYYVDGTLGAVLLIALCLMIHLFVSPRLPTLLMLCMFLMFGVNIKFTAVLYFGIFVCSAVIPIWLFNKKHLYRAWGGLLIALLVGVCVIGMNPYMKNTLSYGHPFFPLAGKNSIDLLTPHTHSELFGHNRLHNLALSIFSPVRNISSFGKTNGRFELKPPFLVDRGEYIALTATDARQGGFGPFFSGLMVISLGVGLVGILLERRRSAPVFFLSAVIFLSVLSNYAAWWARYVPQLWLLPFVFLCSLPMKKPIARTLVWPALILALMNISTVLAANWTYQFVRERNLANQLSLLKKAESAGPLQIKMFAARSVIERVRESGIHPTIVDTLTCEPTVKLLGSPTQLCAEAASAQELVKEAGALSVFDDPYLTLGKTSGFSFFNLMDLIFNKGIKFFYSKLRVPLPPE